MKNWEERSIITANLLNPAFCGEVLRRTIQSYNVQGKGKFPFSLSYLLLPMLLHKQTRDHMPRSSATYFHSWVENNEFLFIDFAERVKQLCPFTNESLMFLLHHGAVSLSTEGDIYVAPYRKKEPLGENSIEIKKILKKAELLGKWLCLTGNEQTIFMFLKIRP